MTLCGRRLDTRLTGHGSAVILIAMSSTRIRTLQRAVDAFGGAKHLAAYLDMALAPLEDWLAGRVETPPEIFAVALDIVAAGPFAAWHGHDDSERAERHQAHANHLQKIADRIKASGERAQRIADQARRTADRSTALVRVQRVLENAIDEQASDRPAEQPSGKLVGEQSADK